MGWKETDERLIRRGELVLDLGFLKNYKEDLKAMNKGKVGPPYRLTPNYIQLLTAVRYLYRMPYRQPWKDSPAASTPSYPSYPQQTTRGSENASWR